MRRRLSLTAALVLLLSLLCACAAQHAQEMDENGYELYFLSDPDSAGGGDAIRTQEKRLTLDGAMETEDCVRALMEALLAGPDDFLVLMVIFFTIINPNFLTVKNLLNVAKQVSIFGIASVGMTYVILLGGIDLATGSIISFVNIVCAYFMVNIGMNVVLAVLLSLIISTFIGFLNGIIIAELRMPALIVTFASQTIFAGYAYIICGGVPISRMPESFLKLGQGYVGPIPVPVMLWLYFCNWYIYLNKHILDVISTHFGGKM